jgi:SAM-dependent methyltransferase
MIWQPTRTVTWPRRPPPLNAQQLEAREKFMQLWHEQLPSKYQTLEQFNHGWVASLPHPAGCRTLEIGAGIGGHLEFENLKDQLYYCLEMRRSFCDQLEKKLGAGRVLNGDVQTKIPSEAHSWDRVIAIHTLEHLPNLPTALQEIKRVLKPGGIFDIVIPCEGGLVYNTARRVSSQRLFERNFKMSFRPIIQNEHVSEYPEIITLLRREFHVEKWKFFPFGVPIYQLNLCVGLRLRSGPGEPAR